MINSRTKAHYQKAYASYKALGSNKNLLKDSSKYKALTYFDTNWEPIKHMWAGYLTKELCHFGCTTTQRVEGSHVVLKRSVALSSRTSLRSMFDIVDTHVKNFFVKADQLSIKERRVVDTLVRSASYMHHLIGRVSHWCLVRVQTNDLEAFALEERQLDNCYCVDPIWFSIPCNISCMALFILKIVQFL